MTARRRTRARRNHPVLRAVAVVALALIAMRLLPLLLVVAAAGGICYWAGRRSRPAVKAKYTTAPVKQPRRPADARARKNGWLPPAAPKLITVGLTPECASADCVSCPGADCGCPCGHDSRVIVAMNTARADAERVPF